MKKLITLFTLVFFLAPSVSNAALVSLTGFEVGTTGETAAVGGSVAPTVQTTTVHSGTYALRVNPTTFQTSNYRLGGAAATGAITVWSLATGYYKFMFRAATLPATEEPMLSFLTAGVSTQWTLRIDSSGVLHVYNNSGTDVGSGCSIATNTWYRLNIQSTFNSTTGTAIVDVDGTNCINLSSIATDAASNVNAFLVLGKVANINSNTVDFFYDDVWVDSATAHGLTKIVAVNPDTNGATMQWTAGTGGSDYQEVDEAAADDADYVQSTAGADVARFGFETFANAGGSGTINGIKHFVRLAEVTTGTSARIIRLVSGGTTSDTTSADAGSATFVSANQFFETDPDTGVAWTETNLNAVEAGIVDNSGTVRLRMGYGSLQVDYTEPVASTGEEDDFDWWWIWLFGGWF